MLKRNIYFAKWASSVLKASFLCRLVPLGVSSEIGQFAAFLVVLEFDLTQGSAETEFLEISGALERLQRKKTVSIA